MSLTPDEIKYDAVWMVVCERFAIPNKECICGYHISDSMGIKSREATQDEKDRVKQLVPIRALFEK